MIRNHGTDLKLSNKPKSEAQLHSIVQPDQSTASSHPALVALVDLLARQAAQEFLSESGLKAENGDPRE